MYSYRTFAIEGQQVKLPMELDPVRDLPSARQFRRERRGMWMKWQQLGLRLPDPETGLVERSSTEEISSVDRRSTGISVPVATAAAAD